MRTPALSLAALSLALSSVTGCMSGVSVMGSNALFKSPDAPIASIDMGAKSGATIQFAIGPATGFATKAGFPAKTWGQVAGVEVELVPNDNSDPTNNPDGHPNFGAVAIAAAAANNYSTVTAIAGSMFTISGPQLTSFTGTPPAKTNNTMQFTNVPVNAKYRLRVRIKNSVPADLIKGGPDLGPPGGNKFALSTNYAAVDPAGTVTYLPTGSRLNVDAMLDDGSSSDPVQATVTVTDGNIPGGIVFTP
jgi:hypothetical protein